VFIIGQVPQNLRALVRTAWALIIADHAFRKSG
jgi:hypothetical protein